MAIRVQLPNSKKPVTKAATVFSSDRAAALARLAKPTPAAETSAPGAVAFRGTNPAMPLPAQFASPVAGRGSMPSATNPGFPVPLPAAGTAPGLTRGAEAAGAGVGAIAVVDGSSDEVEAPVSEALLDPSSAPGKIRAIGLIVKWGVIAGVMLGVGYLALRFLVPFVEEMRNPTPPGAPIKKDAPTAVRMLQETRAVVAKNNANVAHVNDVVAVALGEKTDVKAPAASTPPKVAPEAAGAAPAVARAAVAVVAGSRSALAPFEDSIARLRVGGVSEFPEVRVYLEGRIVKYGEIVDRDLAIRFMGVDAENKMLLFTNADNVLFRRPY